MQYLKVFRTTFIIFGFVIVCFGCAAGKNVTKIEADFSLTATATSEGILLHFYNIPENTIELYVGLLDITSNDQVSTFVHILDNELTEIKKTGNLLCPFVKNGHEYEIKAVSFTGKNYSDTIACSINVVAVGGIQVVNNPLLFWDDKDYSITLSEQPVFSDEVIFSKPPAWNSTFVYFINVKEEFMEEYRNKGQNWDGLIAGSDDLTYSFPQISNEFKKHFGIIEDIPVFISVYCNLSYGKLEWCVVLEQLEDAIGLI